MCSAVVRASSRIPHSVAKGPPEWSHETEFPGGTRSSPDRRGVGVYATNGCIAPPGGTGRAYIPPGDIHHHPSNLCSAFDLVYRIPAGPLRWIRILLILGGRKRSKRWEAESESELPQRLTRSGWKAQD